MATSKRLEPLMLRCLVIIIISIFSFCKSAKASDIGEVKIDSIFRVTEKLIGNNELDSAQELIRTIRLLSQEFKYDWGQVQSILLDGLLYYKKDQLDSASNKLLEAIDQAKSKRPYSYEEGRASILLGLLYRQLNNLEKAEKYFNDAFKSFISLNDSIWVSNSVNNLGIVYASRGDYPEALQEFKMALDYITPFISDNPNAATSYASTLGNIAVLHELMGNPDLALDVARKALQLRIKANETSAILTSYINIGEIHFGKKNYDSAKYFYNYVINKPISEDARIQSLQARANQKMATILIEEGRNEDALTFLLTSLNLRKNNNIGLDDTYRLLANYHLDLKNYDSAIHYSRKAFMDAKTNANKRSTRAASKLLSTIFKNQSIYDSALFYQDLYHVYSDSIFNASNDRKYNNLRVEMATAEKESEIELLKKESELITKNYTIKILIAGSIIIFLIMILVALFYRYIAKKKTLALKQAEHRVSSQRQELELQHLTLQMINKTKSIQDLEEKLEFLNRKENLDHQDIRKVINGLEFNSSMEKEWNEFQNYFKTIHPQFFENILSKHSNLTQYERRLLALIKLDLSNREIASLMNIEQSSIRQNKYRLKKKLNLESEDSLEVYVNKI